MIIWMEREAPCVAYKEWAPVVAHLAAGRQILLLRKGGIAEGPGGFQPAHDWFWFLPTRFHPAADKLQPGTDAADEPPPGRGLAASVVQVCWLEDESRAAALAQWHCWAPEEIARRFHFGKRPGLFALVVRVWCTVEPAPVLDEAAAAGCRSWVEVPARPGPMQWTPVLDEAAFASSSRAVMAALGGH